MKYTTTYPSPSTHPFRFCLLLCLITVLSGFSSGQASQDFSTSTTGTDHFVDSGSGLVQHVLVNNPSPQTQPNAATNGTTLGYQVTFTPTRTGSSNVGLTDGELFGPVDVTVPASPDNNLGSLTIDFMAATPPSGNNNVYLLEDPDGLATLRFNPVLVDASTMFSMAFIVANTSYENTDGVDDRIDIYLENTATGVRTSLYSATNASIVNDEVWRTLTANLGGMAGQEMQLVVEFDSNSASEEMAIDAISFSSGTVVAGWPECEEPTVPALTQFPASVCPGLPFRLQISGDLNGATEWRIYADENAAQLIGVTSGNTFDVAEAAPGTALFVRGEGGCASLPTFGGLVVSTETPGDCLPDATPGTSFEEPLGSSEDYVDTENPLVNHALVNNPGQPSVNHPFRAREMGFTTQFLARRSGSSGEAGLTDGDAFGVSNDPSFAFPDGNQGLVLEDTDGRIVIIFTPLDLIGLTDVVVSFDYFVNPTTYENSDSGSDNFVVAMANNGVNGEEVMISSFGDGSTGLPGLAVGEWTTFTYTLTRNYTAPVSFAIAADFDAGSERVLFDNISFSAGTIACQDTEAPVVSCPAPISIDAGDDCMAVATFVATALDDCSRNVALTYSQESGTAFPVGATTVTVTGTDEGGMSGTCNFTVTVNDVTPPTLDCPEITVKLDSAQSCDYILVTDAALDPVATDNCAGVTLVNGSGLASLAGDTIFAETTEIFWTATDAADLAATCTQVVNVTVPPSCFPTSVSHQDASDFSAVRTTPNPFTERTTISFQLPFSAEVQLDVLDLSGRVLQSAKVFATGYQYSWTWAAADASGGRAPAGVYFVRLRARGQVYTERVVLLR